MSMRRLSPSLIIGIVAGVLAVTSCNPGGKRAEPSETSVGTLFSKSPITVALKNDQPGTSFNAGGYTWSGFDYDLAKYIAQHFNVEMNPLDVPSERRVTYLQEHRVDLVISTFSYTPDRAKQVELAGPYMTTSQGVLVKSDDKSIRTTMDLKGKTVCAATGSTSLDVIQRPGYGILPKEEPDFSTCVRDLRQDKVQAVSTDQVILYGYAHHYRGLRVVRNAVLGELSRYVIGLPPGHNSDCVKVATAIQNFLKSSQWTDVFSSNLPTVVKTDASWQNHFEPSPDEVKCQS